MWIVDSTSAVAIATSHPLIEIFLIFPTAKIARAFLLWIASSPGRTLSSLGSSSASLTLSPMPAAFSGPASESASSQSSESLLRAVVRLLPTALASTGTAPPFLPLIPPPVVEGTQHWMSEPPGQGEGYVNFISIFSVLVIVDLLPYFPLRKYPRIHLLRYGRVPGLRGRYK